MEENELKLTAILKDAQIIVSVSEGKRLIKQGGMRVDGVPISDQEFILNLKAGLSVTIKAGKRKFLRINRGA